MFMLKPEHKPGGPNQHAVPMRSHPAKHGEDQKQSVPRRSHPAQSGVDL